MRTNENKMTTITIPTLKESLKTCVCEILGISEEKHSQLINDTAYTYLESYLPCVDAQSKASKVRWVKAITTTTAFWNWWTRRWESRDEIFINHDLNKPENLKAYAAWYYYFNSGEYLAQNLRLPGVITNEAYKELNK